MAISKIILNGITQMDLTQDTVSQAGYILAPYIGHLNNGVQVTGTGTGSASVTEVENEYGTEVIIITGQTPTPEPEPDPTPSGNWTTIYDGTLQTENGMDIISELSDWYFTDGKQYRVTIDGTSYTCTAETNDTGAVLIGNFDLYNDITASGDYPFLCFNIGWGGVYVYLQNGGNTTHTFKLEEEQTSA